MKKTGRNEPCPCGSGKKYKHCCLERAPAPTANLTWTKMRQTEGELVPALIRHADRYYGPEAMAEAWDDFSLGSGAPMDPDSEPELHTLFLPWFVFNWVPDNSELDEAEHLPEKPVALHYLERMDSRLDAFQRRFIQEVCSQPYSFFMVTGTEPGETLSMRDLLLGREVTVYERQASQMVRKGSVIYARIMTMDGASIMLGCAPLLIPATYVNMLIDLREDLARTLPRLDQEILLAIDTEVRSIYYDIREEIHNPSPPALCNTDGEPLQPTTLHYALKCAPREAFDALVSLSLGSADDYIEHGKFDAQGELCAIEFPWQKKGNRQHPSWDNTIMGHIAIDGARMTIDVNSQQRADAIKRKITRRLGKRAVFQNAVIQSVEKMFQDLDKKPASRRDRVRKEDANLMADPEVQAILREMAERHWQDWLDTPLPALKDQTPREAAKTPLGRERLEALLLEFEGREDTPEPFAPDVAALRRTLGLA